MICEERSDFQYFYKKPGCISAGNKIESNKA